MAHHPRRTAERPSPRTRAQGIRGAALRLVAGALAPLKYHRSVNIYATAVGLSVLGSLGGLLTASAFLLLGDHLRVKLVPWLISYAVGTLLGVGAARAPARSARTHRADARARDFARRRAGVLSAREARVVATLPRYARMRGAHEQRRVARDRRRRVPHVRRRRRHRGGGDYVGTARHYHGARRCRARDPTGSRRRRHPAARRILEARARSR